MQDLAWEAHVDKVDKILIVDDEKNITSIIAYNLQKEGYETIESYDGNTGLGLALSENPDLIILDIMMPGLDGFEVCKHIRDENPDVPIIMLTARVEEVDKVLGLEIGADDYVTKPFGVRELMARVKANLRRKTSAAPKEKLKTSEESLLTCGDLTINPDLYEVRRGGQLMDLTRREFELVKYLATQNDQVFTRENLLENIWGFEWLGDVRTVDVTIRRLRTKLEANPNEPKYVLTKRGVGYYFMSGLDG